ncbi:MAG: hypothetical protein WBE26_15615 [Phycisphaerae bacterium]
MKRGRRHELKENDLLNALEVARQYLEKNSKQIGIAVILVAAVIVAAIFGLRSRAVAGEDLWRRKNQLSFDDPEIGRQSLEALVTMTQGVSDRQFMFSSLMDQGLHALRLARDVPFPPDRELNETARKAFEQLLEQFGDNPLAAGLAHNSLATVEENAFVLDEDPVHKKRAEVHLSAVIDDPALNAMPFKRIAMDRRKALDETFTTIVFDYTPREQEPADQKTAPGMPIKIEPVKLETVDDVVDLPEPVDPLPIDVPEDTAGEGDSSGDTTTSPIEGPGSDSADTDPEKQEATSSQPTETP